MEADTYFHPELRIKMRGGIGLYILSQIFSLYGT